MDTGQSLVVWSSVGKGFFAGTLLGAVILLNVDLPIKALMFIYAVLIGLDTFLPGRAELYSPMMSIVLLIVGIGISSVLSFLYIWQYVLLVVVIGSLSYLYKIVKHIKGL